MNTLTLQLDPTTGARTQYQDSANTFTRRKTADLLELVHTLRKAQKNYYSCKDSTLKQEFLIAAVIIF